MAKLGVTPTHKTVDQLRKTILSPSLTPYFEVQFPVPSFLSNLNSGKTSPYNYLTLLCTEAVLPGNKLVTFDVNNDYTGVTEKMPHRKLYDQNLSLTFYVNSGEDAYYPIKFFESYIAYIAGEDPSNASSLDRLRNQNYFYRMSYPDEYMIDGLYIKKFEKGGKFVSPTPGLEVDRELTYEFIRTYPTAINSMQLTYGEAQVLKCTVQYSYLRYVQHDTFKTSRVEPSLTNIVASVPNTDPLDPENNILNKTQERQAQHPNGFGNALLKENDLLRDGKTRSEIRREQNPNFGRGSREDPSTPQGQIRNRQMQNQPQGDIGMPEELPLIPPVMAERVPPQ